MRDGVLYGTMFGAGLATALVAGSMLGELGVTPKPPESLPVHAAALPAQPMAETKIATPVVGSRSDTLGADAAVGASTTLVSNNRIEVVAALPATAAIRLPEARALGPLEPVAVDRRVVLATPARPYPLTQADQLAVRAPLPLVWHVAGIHLDGIQRDIADRREEVRVALDRHVAVAAVEDVAAAPVALVEGGRIASVHETHSAPER